MEVKWSCLLCWVGQVPLFGEGGWSGWLITHTLHTHTIFSLSFLLSLFRSLPVSFFLCFPLFLPLYLKGGMVAFVWLTCLTKVTAACRCMWMRGSARALFVHLSAERQGERVKRNKLVPKGRPFTFCTPSLPPVPPSHSGARRDPQVLAGLFHFVPPIVWSPQVFYPSFWAPQSTSKQRFERSMAHFAQAFARFYSLSFSVLYCVFTQWRGVVHNSNRLVPQNMLFLSFFNHVFVKYSYFDTVICSTDTN